MAIETPVNIGTLITATPGVQGGKPCIAGTRIRVQTIAIRFDMGETIEDFIETWTYLDRSHFHAALAYYYANKAQIDQDIEDEERLGAELAAKYPHGWTPETNH